MYSLQEVNNCRWRFLHFPQQEPHQELQSYEERAVNKREKKFPTISRNICWFPLQSCTGKTQSYDTSSIKRGIFFPSFILQHLLLSTAVVHSVNTVLLLLHVTQATGQAKLTGTMSWAKIKTVLTGSKKKKSSIRQALWLPWTVQTWTDTVRAKKRKHKNQRCTDF